MFDDSDLSIASVLNQAQHYLSSVTTGNAESAEIDARILLQNCLEQSHSYLLTWPEKCLTKTEFTGFLALLKRRFDGEPIAYITGIREFWSMELMVSADTLIPRPETELLVELALKNIPLNDSIDVLDMGTGSGAIALAIASERPQIQIWASDISNSALDIAKANAARLKISNIQFIKSDWGQNLPEIKFDGIVSNPPYIDKSDPHLKQGDLRFEPEVALSSADQGLSDLKAIINYAKNHLKPSAWLLMEHGFNQHQEVLKLLKQSHFEKLQNCKDLSGKPRVTGGVLNKTTLFS